MSRHAGPGARATLRRAVVPSGATPPSPAPAGRRAGTHDTSLALSCGLGGGVRHRGGVAVAVEGKAALRRGVRVRRPAGAELALAAEARAVSEAEMTAPGLDALRRRVTASPPRPPAARGRRRGPSVRLLRRRSCFRCTALSSLPHRRSLRHNSAARARQLSQDGPPLPAGPLRLCTFSAPRAPAAQCRQHTGRPGSHAERGDWVYAGDSRNKRPQ